ncbi:hypothetical protein ACN93_01165 [Gordonia paraffinivorans]|uniref:serine/threonine-protein kinase n=1 Tax=Gordonia paraffinivorans TaxID=175628 RepID=UPI000D605BFE|nr:serine/threonine-protein kinase [Gordonia paraffinivorans]PWD44685.1 hypothetical protein ACN93_01165 [Gordonia paraffinivorans]
MVGNRVGTQFGPYRLDELLGRGGMGEVYRASDTVKDRTVALKLLNPGLADDSTYQERFRRESRAVARLGEPHVIPIHDWGEIDGVLFIDMRLVDGHDLRSLLQTDGKLAPSRAVSVVAQVASALDAAHRVGLVHRDVKPENILITANDFAYLVDFGIVQSGDSGTLTTSGNAIGSVGYMAPERFDGGPVGPSADIYALGCVLFECLSGRPPFPADSISGVIKAVVMDSPPLLSSVGGAELDVFDPVLARALAKEPSQRYATVLEFCEAAEGVVSGVSKSGPRGAHESVSDGGGSAFFAPFAPTVVNRQSGEDYPGRAPGQDSLGQGTRHLSVHSGERLRSSDSGEDEGGALRSSARRDWSWRQPAVFLVLGILIGLAIIGGWLALRGDGGDEESVGPSASAVATQEPTRVTETRVEVRTETVTPRATTPPEAGGTGDPEFLRYAHENCGNGGYADTRNPSRRATCAWVARAAEYVRGRAPDPVVSGVAYSEVAGGRSYTCTLRPGAYYECISQSRNVFWVVS